MADKQRSVVPPTEVQPKAKRRAFSAEFKRRILAEVDACTKPGEIGVIPRREGLYRSHLVDWRAARERGELEALAPKKRGPKPSPGPDARDREIEDLKRQLTQTTVRAERAEALVEIQKKSPSCWGHRSRPRKAGADAAHPRARWPARHRPALRRAQCRTRQPLPVEEPLHGPHRPRSCPRALSTDERQGILDLLHSPRFVDRAPAEVVATLLDDSTYWCSERTMYRILAGCGEVRERRNQLRRPLYAKPELLATRPGELWSWDITKLLGPARWTYFYLYVILDVFSRYFVGWMIATCESAALAEDQIRTTCARQGIAPGKLTIHADRGSSMTSKPVALLLADLGITKTHSRPHVSNDNPFSEAQFKTLKYRPDFPDRFGSLEHARGHCAGFFDWYNLEQSDRRHGRRRSLILRGDQRDQHRDEQRERGRGRTISLRGMREGTTPDELCARSAGYVRHEPRAAAEKMERNVAHTEAKS